jgi:hypothetical protein
MRPHGLSDEEYAAIRALQEAEPAPPADSPLWAYLASRDLVAIDRSVEPPTVTLTPYGRTYPAD